MDELLNDRGVQLVMAADAGLDLDAARLRLERATLVLDIDDEAGAAAHALALAAARCALKMFRGGVFLRHGGDGPRLVGFDPPGPLKRVLVQWGVKLTQAPAHALRLRIGARVAAESADLYAWTDGWTARIAPTPPKETSLAGNAVSGVLAGAMAVAELFRRAVLDDVLALRAPRALSAWGPGDAPADAAISKLPQALWLLGLGNLGQASAFTLGLLPWRDTGEVSLLLQDGDRVGPENLMVQLLTDHSWIRQKKARALAAWFEARGFVATIEERRYRAGMKPEEGEPRLMLAGVDNLTARRAAAVAGFDLVLDAGLGATGAEAFDLRLHAFPGSISVEQAWPDLQQTAPTALRENLEKLVSQGRIDMCGAQTIAGKAVGVPVTALAAAALQIGQLCRALATGRCAEKVDVSLADVSRAHWRMMERPLAPFAALDAGAP